MKFVVKVLSAEALLTAALILCSVSVAQAEPPPNEPTAQPSPAIEPSPAPAPSPTVVPGSQRWTGGSGGLILGYSPLFRPKIATASRLNCDKFSSFDVGLELKNNVSISARISGATVPSLTVYNSSAFQTTYYTDAPASLYEILVSINAPLNEPYSKLGPVQFFLPLQFGSSYLTITGGSNKYTAMAFEGALGLGARVYTWSTVRFDISGLYRFGLPLIGITQSDSTLVTVQNSIGENIKSSLEGMEMRIGITFMLPSSHEDQQQ
ncbi:hypothetical protein WDW37_11745 [Bdellovibrionota bacterium FG-1]